MERKFLPDTNNLKPSMQEEEAQMTTIVATSLPFGNKTVDGGDALTKSNEWDIWGDADIEE